MAAAERKRRRAARSSARGTLAATAADAVLPLDQIGPFLYGLLCEPAGNRVRT